jgi:hypothetical protein
MVLMGTPGVGMTLTEGLSALRAYQPSHDAMRDLLRNYFAADPAMITDDLVQIERTDEFCALVTDTLARP